ncbi:hypothetical protein [Mycolicibacterium aromaticivorans]|nr:hypothetical protein [Mycolicibacterium aromaticivorans]
MRIGTAERQEAQELALTPLAALACTILVPHGWLAWLALPVLGLLLFGRR